MLKSQQRRLRQRESATIRTLSAPGSRTGVSYSLQPVKASPVRLLRLGNMRRGIRLLETMRVHTLLTQSRHLFSLLLISFLLAPAAIALNFGPQSSSTSLLSGTGDFLPVTEAFQLEARIDQGELILHWDVASEYYLYKERFKLSSETQPGSGLDVVPAFSPDSIEVYDEFFERDMEVYYHSATLTLPLPDSTEAFTLRVESQGCADAGLCYPPHADYLHIEPELNRVSALDPESVVPITTRSEERRVGRDGRYQGRHAER